MADHDLGETTLTVGERLRQAREAKGLTLDDVAAQTRIPTRHLRHIEQEEWDELPAVTYCVGFVRSYANAVDLDGAELGRDVRERLGGTRTRAPAPEYFEPADPARVPPRSLALIAAIIAIALIVGYGIWRSSLGEEDEVAEAPEAAPAATQPAPAAPAAPSPQALAAQPVTLTATEEVWVRITDGPNGASLFEGIMAPGQRWQVPATAQQPVIRTGRPQVIRAALGARDIGPLEPAERTVSNFSLRAQDLAARTSAQPTPVLPQPTPIPPQ